MRRASAALLFFVACTSSGDEGPSEATIRDGLTPVGGTGGAPGFEGSLDGASVPPLGDVDPAECHPDLQCDNVEACPPAPAFCGGDPAEDLDFDPTFRDEDDGVGDLDLDADYVRPSGDELDFWPESQTRPFQLRLAETPVAGETLLERDGRAYLEFRYGERTVRVLNDDSPPFDATRPTADVTLRIGSVPVDSVELVPTLEPLRPGSDVFRLASVSVFLANASDSPASEPIANQSTELALPGFDDCKSRAVRRFAEGSYNGQWPADMPPVKFPPIRDNRWSDCSLQQCEDIYHGWLRAHHNVWRAHQMLQILKDVPNNGQRGYAWGRPGRNGQGELASERSSPRHWFGSFSDDAFRQTRTVVNKLWERFRKNKVGALNLDLRCPTSGGNVCATNDAVAAHHVIAGQIDFCDGYFESNGGCLSGWNEELGICFGLSVSGDWSRARLMAHELLHHTTIDGRFVKDKHSHGHGDSCLKNVKILQTMYGYSNIRHFAGVGNCSHNWKGRRNNDSYAYFITEVGDLIYRGEMTTWPAWGDPTPMPPENCDVGTVGCYCDPVDPRFDSPDGDYRADQWCPDDEGETTCQTTKFNAVDIVGICTRCDEIRGGGCECDVDRPCDVGSCWGDSTANGRLTVGRCYEAPPPSWACLADCQALYNRSTARCYHDHPSGRARCIDGVICEEVDEFGCFQQGKVCYDGACITECVTTQDCRYDAQPNELDLDYPSYFSCSVNLFCEPMP